MIDLAAGDPITPVWVNEVGGLTFQLGDGATRRFAKWAPHGRGLDLAGESARLQWAVEYAAVPRVLAEGCDADAEWLVTAGLPGRSAADDRWLADPARAVSACGQALRAFHDTVPVGGCPFDWSIETRGAGSTFDTRDAPPIDRLVVCHGDPCVPNTILNDDGSWSGMVDLDALGTADRWADIAVATMSLTWNYGPGWDAAFFEAYGVDDDPVRVEFYRALWNRA